MAMKIYQYSMFMVLFNIAMAVANLFASYIFFYYPTQITINPLGIDLGFLGGYGNVAALVVGASTLAIFQFGFLAVTLPFVIGLFLLCGIINIYYLSMLGLPSEVYLFLTIPIAIIYAAGISQYASRSSFQGQ